MHNVSGMFSVFSYVYIITCVVFCFLFKDKSNEYLFIQLGLIGTLGADFFLVLLPSQVRFPGMICFSFVQICYFLRLYMSDTNKKRRNANLIMRIIGSVAVVALTFLVLGPGADPVAVISMFYYVNLFLNVIFAFLDFQNTVFHII
jgi:uncharacterized membrane protein YhhN